METLRLLALLALAASLAVAAAGFAGMLFLGENSVPAAPGGRGGVEAWLKAVVDVRPVRLLGMRESVEVVDEARVPLPVVRLVRVEPGLSVWRENASLVVEAERLSVTVVVHGFPVVVWEEECRGNCSLVGRVAELSPERLLEEARNAAEEAGLGQVERLEALVTYSVRVQLDFNGTTRDGWANATLRLTSVGRMLELQAEKGEFEASWEPTASSRGDKRRWMLMAAGGSLAAVLSALGYAELSPKPLAPPSLAVEAEVKGLPRVAVRDPRKLVEFAKRHGALLLRTGSQLCTVVHGVAYCAKLPEEERGSPPAAGGEEGSGASRPEPGEAERG